MACAVPELAPRGREQPWPPDLFDEQRDYARCLVIDQCSEEILDASHRLVAGRDDVGEADPFGLDGIAGGEHHGAALGKEGHRWVAVAGWLWQCHAKGHAVHVIDEAKAVRPQHGDAGSERLIG